MSWILLLTESWEDGGGLVPRTYIVALMASELLLTILEGDARLFGVAA